MYLKCNDTRQKLIKTSELSVIDQVSKAAHKLKIIWNIKGSEIFHFYSNTDQDLFNGPFAFKRF